eukprot:797305-Prymnesium_polylepis.1
MERRDLGHDECVGRALLVDAWTGGRRVLLERVGTAGDNAATLRVGEGVGIDRGERIAVRVGGRRGRGWRGRRVRFEQRVGGLLHIALEEGVERAAEPLGERWVVLL